MEEQREPLRVKAGAASNPPLFCRSCVASRHCMPLCCALLCVPFAFLVRFSRGAAVAAAAAAAGALLGRAAPLLLSASAACRPSLLIAVSVAVGSAECCAGPRGGAMGGARGKRVRAERRRARTAAPSAASLRLQTNLAKNETCRGLEGTALGGMDMGYRHTTPIALRSGGWS